MVRGVTIIIILTVFMQVNMGSIFDQFSSPEKRDKNKMLMFLRGLLKLDTPNPEGRGHINKRGITTASTTSKNEFQQIWDSKKLPDRSDKSKMLSYLRGLKAPNSAFSVYEVPKHQAFVQVQKAQDIQTNQITQNLNTRRSQNTQDKQNVVINSEHSDVQSSEQKVNWDGATATQVTLLQPAEHERDSDTCFWRGQQAHPVARAGPKAENAGSGKGQSNVEPYVDFENMGENLISTWECIQKKFFLSYEKLKAKICGMMNSNPPKGK